MLSDHTDPDKPTGALVPHPGDTFLKRATSIVLEHLDDADFGVDKFCKEIGMSHTSLHTKLKTLTDHSITRFVRSIRIQKAAELIEQNMLTMADVALAVGFNNRQFFIRSFKEHFGMTPTVYKAMIKKNVILAGMGKKMSGAAEAPDIEKNFG